MRILPLACVGAVLASCSASAATRAFAVGGFDRIDARSSVDVRVRTGGAPSARADGDPQIIDRLIVEAHGGVLHIGTRPGSWPTGSHIRTVVTVTLPRLTGVTLGGSGDLDVDHVKAGAFTLAMSGSGNARLGTVEATAVTLDMTGSGDVEAAGRARRVEIVARGSGDVRASRLLADTTRVSLTGAGDIAIGARSAADIKLLGSGDVTISGTPRCTVEKHGSGSVNCGRG